ncbi:MAG: site-specific DNA-methyltransferase [Bacteroidales bacterium]|nr:site-specific DNA-methyltransferase [Bacteroidales bacterium]
MNKYINKYINSILEGDTLDIMKGIPDNSVDMLLVDLPYGTTQNKWDSIIPLDELWKEYKRIVKINGAMVFTASGLFSAQLMLSNPKDYKYKIIWEKSKATNFLNAKKQPLRKFEEILVFYRKQPTYNPQMREGKAYDKGIRKNQLTGSYGDFDPIHVKSEGKRYPVDIVYFKTAESEGEVVHPTQKPVELGRYLIRTFSNPGDVVLDNTSGSGSFLVSAIKEGRNFIGIEKNEHSKLFKDQEDIDYIEISKNRVLDCYSKLDDYTKKTIKKKNLFKKVQ